MRQVTEKQPKKELEGGKSSFGFGFILSVFMALALASLLYLWYWLEFLN